jgi:hypothetical protein
MDVRPRSVIAGWLSQSSEKDSVNLVNLTVRPIGLSVFRTSADNCTEEGGGLLQGGEAPARGRLLECQGPAGFVAKDSALHVAAELEGAWLVEDGLDERWRGAASRHGGGRRGRR